MEPVIFFVFLRCALETRVRSVALLVLIGKAHASLTGIVPGGDRKADRCHMVNFWRKGALACAVLPMGLLVCGCTTAGIGEKGVAEVKKGNWEAARAHFASDYNRYPGHPIAVFNMGDTYHHDGDIQQADAKFSDAVTVGKTYQPDEFLEPNSRSATIAQISCRHLHEDNKLNAECGDQIAVLVPPAPPTPVAQTQPEQAPQVEAQATTVPNPPKQDRN